MSDQRDNGLSIQFENNKITSWFRERSELLKTGEGSITVPMPVIRSTALIALCFLLTSTGWLSWEYHLMDQVAAGRRVEKTGSPEEESGNGSQKSGRANVKPLSRSFILMAGALVLLFSIVNGSGFSFPAADLGDAVNVELSRLVYAVGLVIAGYVTDKNRKYGAICALTALVIPFIILSLRGGTFSAVLFWALSYFTFGFYSVYRVILFSDIASDTGILPLACLGPSVPKRRRR